LYTIFTLRIAFTRASKTLLALFRDALYPQMIVLSSACITSSSSLQ